ncbi:MAG: hypothetical protein OFPII_13830 [Osedax symbiont Rs1]|nr:MAG: hypothetical protein OFPII_13830 [Osedax symbiont Rs1]
MIADKNRPQHSSNIYPKILLIDDVQLNLIAVETLLKPLQAEIITANNGNLGLAKALEHDDIALILLDVNMPEMDGFEVARLLNDIQETANIPIIFLTASQPNEQHQLQAYKNGAVDYILKPLNPDVLISKVKIFINIWTMHFNMEQEIARRIIAEQEIEHLAMHDPLTQLPNRWHIHESMTQAISRAKRLNGKLAVLFLDLDGFKKINDELGHIAGDLFLKEISARFKRNIRSFDLIARYGGDEFIIVLTDIDDTLSLTNKLTKLTQAAAKAIYWHGKEMQAGVSIGVSLYPEHGTDSGSLIHCADNAMYQAKQAGRNTFRFYTQSLNDALQRKILLETHLRKALEFGELEVYYQPIVDTNTGEVIGAEALLRWFNKQLGTIAPDEFIKIAEDIGIIHQLGIWVLKEAVKVMQLHPLLSIAINVSALQFNNDQLIDAIQDYLAKGVIQARQIVVEITEGILLENTNQVQQRLECIKNKGVLLSIDDFGTGYSALSYLKRCPVNLLKIDRSFIIGVPDDRENATLIKGIIAMAHALGMQVVAEGVETAEQWLFLRELNCNTSQGYHFSPPLSLTQFNQYLKNSSSESASLQSQIRMPS